MNVEWSNQALQQLISIYDYISRDSNFYAQRMVDRITSRSKQLGNFPLSGGTVPEFQDKAIREVVEGAYRIIYRVEANRIFVLSVIHGSMNLTSPPSSDDVT